MADLYDPYSGLYTRGEINRAKKYLKEELQRTVKSLKRPGKPSVYYLAYLFRNQRTEKLWGRLGAVNRHEVASANHVFCDLRVGSYKYDNLTHGGLNDNSSKDESVDYVYMPTEIREDAFKYGLWKLTDARYREAAEQYYDKKSRELHFVDPNRKLPSRMKRKAIKQMGSKRFEEIDVDYWRYLIRKAGTLIKKYTRIKNSWTEFTSRHNQHLLVNSEGTEILRQTAIFELRAHIWLLSPKGEGISQDINIVEGNPNDLPSEKEFLKLIKQRLDLLFELEKAPELNSFSGPVLLSPIASGVFFHEVVGHRLEGSRLLSPDEGATFRSLRGKRITPDYIDIVDDPTQLKFGGRTMIGHFNYDDEGSASRKAVLVEKGVLKNFLTTAMPIPGQKELNGHARNMGYERPISRMGNLFVINRKPIPEQDLKEMFLEEIKAQKKPHGIYVKDVLGGETDTSSYDFQAFKGEIMHAVKLMPNGKEIPIRGVDFVGTPLSALDSVLSMGDDPQMDNSYCGAESGVVPVSTISPSMLLRNLELQSRNRERLTQYVMPLPFERAANRKRRRRPR